MSLLNDLLDFSDHPLMPPPSAQMFAEHLPAECIQHCLTLSKHATVRPAFGFIRTVFTSDTRLRLYSFLWHAVPARR